MDQTTTFKCLNCGAGLIFDAQSQKLHCEFCLSDFSEAELNTDEARAEAEREAEADREFDRKIVEYHCASCGADVITDDTTVATVCYYCHNPVVVTDRVSGGLRPTKLIPFKFDREEAKQIFLRYAKKKFFAPKDYFSDANADKMSGIYYPFWVTDADTSGSYSADGRRVRSWTAGDYRYTETTKYKIERYGDIHFEDISTAAISSEDKRMLEGILPYPTDSYIDFSIPYLQGFVAKKRNIERAELYAEVKNRMDSYADTLFTGTVGGYASITNRRVDIGVHKSHWEYSLMPIWILNYKYRDKNYTYAMNGYTGKLYGEIPISLPKMLLYAGGLFLLITLLCAFFGWLLF